MVCVETGETAISVEGEAQLISNVEERALFNEVYGPKYSMDMESFSEPVYRVTPNKAIGIDASGDNFTSSATRWQFDEA